MLTLILQLAAGLAYGMILLLVALGLTIVFGLGRVVNFAHGAIYALGAYVGVAVASLGGFWFALIVAPLLVGALTAAMDLLLIRRIRKQPEEMTLVLTFGVLLIIDNVIRQIWGTSAYYIETPKFMEGNWSLGEATISRYQAFAAVLAIAVCSALLWTLYKTSLGLRFRAASSNPDHAELFGIRVNRLLTGVFALGGALAAFAGVVSVPLYSAVPGMDEILPYAFVIVILGGLGSLRGTVIAALLVGLIISVGSAYIANWSHMLVFIIMLMILVLEPRGILREGRVL